MQQKIVLKLLPNQAEDEAYIRNQIAKVAQKNISTITGYNILKKSLDARAKKIIVNITLVAFFNVPFTRENTQCYHFKNVEKSTKSVVIIGAGPAGLFAALKLLENGIKPIILERGKEVRARRRDLANLNKTGIINPESNYCFGEGGAGTYSDGKLYTRSNKRGDIDRILKLFIQFGAPANIAYDAHPHIGTNKLPQIIIAMRQQILACGGLIFFEKKVTDILLDGKEIIGVTTACKNTFKADAYILATGHSANDIFHLLHKKNILIEPKPFALGVRVEHPQKLIDNIQYHYSIDNDKRDDYLPAAPYSLVAQVNGRGVFSFCMCPGGIIAPAATNPNELVVNGWSPSKRNNAFANSGIVVQVEKKDALEYLQSQQIECDEKDPLLFLKFQQLVEQQCYTAGGGSFVAPAQRLQDFVHDKLSPNLPINSYIPGLKSVQLKKVLPPFIYEALAGGFTTFGKKLKGFYTNNAIVVAVESRTSSPVRIPRNNETLQHPDLQNFYPCGEGAGYAGGIVSAAMDGERVAGMIINYV